jgi:hypothetical protein
MQKKNLFMPKLLNQAVHFLPLLILTFLFSGCPNSGIRKLIKVGGWNTTYQPGYVAFNVFVEGSLAYLAFGEAGLQIINISDPTNPVLVGSCPTIGPNRDVYVTGNYAFLACSEKGLVIADISNPANPVSISTLNTGGYSFGVSVAGSHCYLADGGNGLTVVDISNPANPIQKGNCVLPVSANDNDVFVSGGYAYVANNSGGLQILNVINPANPVIWGKYDQDMNAYDVFREGSKVYIADYSSGLKIFDVSDNSTPKMESTYKPDPIDLPHKLYVDNGFVYLADWNKLSIINTDEGSPIEVAKYIPPSPYSVRGVYVVNDHVFVAQAYGTEALVIFSYAMN